MIFQTTKKSEYVSYNEVKKISRNHDKHNVFGKVTPENIPNRKLDNITGNENIFKLFHKYVLEFKGNCNNDTMIKILSSEDDVFYLILIKFKKK